MATRGLSFGYLDLPPWDEDRWRGLETLLGFQEPDPVCRAEIEHQVCLYLCSAGGQLGDRPPHVRTPEMTRRLERIAQVMETLAELLRFEGSTDQERVEGRVARVRLAEHAGLVRLEALPAILEALAAGARAAAMGPPPRKGRPEDEAFDYFVWRLADLFERVTKQRATVDRRWRSQPRYQEYHGAFFEFMAAVVTDLPGSLREGQLGEKIRRALDRRRALIRQELYSPLTR